MQQEWQMSRYIAYSILMVNQDPKKAKIKKPTDLFELEIDNPNQTKKPIKKAVIRKVDV